MKSNFTIRIFICKIVVFIINDLSVQCALHYFFKIHVPNT